MKEQSLIFLSYFFLIFFMFSCLMFCFMFWLGRALNQKGRTQLFQLLIAQPG